MRREALHAAETHHDSQDRALTCPSLLNGPAHVLTWGSLHCMKHSVCPQGHSQGSSPHQGVPSQCLVTTSNLGDACSGCFAATPRVGLACMACICEQTAGMQLCRGVQLCRQVICRANHATMLTEWWCRQHWQSRGPCQWLCAGGLTPDSIRPKKQLHTSCLQAAVAYQQHICSSCSPHASPCASL